MEIVSKRGEELDVNTVVTRNWAIIKQKETMKCFVPKATIKQKTYAKNKE